MASAETPPSVYVVTGSSGGKLPSVYLVTEETSVFKGEPLPAPSVDCGASHCPTNQLRIHFCISKILLVALVVVAVTVLIVGLFMGNGIHLFSVKFEEVSDANRKKLLDKYNSRFSNFMAAVNKVLELAIQPLVAVAILCLGAKWITRKGEASNLVGVAPTLFGAALGFLVCNGPTSVNVQLVPGRTQVRMLAEDMTAQVVNTDNSSTWNTSLVENSPNNSVLNTILRTRYSAAENVGYRCELDGLDKEFGWQIEPPHVTFGYPEMSWMLGALPTAINPENVFDIPVGGSESGNIVDLDFPADLATARTLYIMALAELYGNLGALWGLTVRHGDAGDFYRFVHDSRAAAMDKWTADAAASNDAEVLVGDLMAFAGDNFVPAAAIMLQDLLSKVTSVITDEVGAVYQIHQLADSLSYTSLTLTIPTRTLDVADVNQTVSISKQCAPDGCLLVNDSLFGATVNEIKPIVQVAAIWNDSEWIPDYGNSDCALVISSLGKRISGDDFNLTLTDAAEAENRLHIVATELRTTYSLTVGMLNWTSEDLAVAIGAECADESTNCTGVRISTDALKQQNKILFATDSMYDSLSYLDNVVEALDLNLISYPYDWLTWEKLVQVDKAQPMLLPRNFGHVDQAARDYLPLVPSDACCTQADWFLNNTVKNHLFAEESLQISYTAGLHFAFKTGVLHTISSSDGVVNLAGNRNDFKVQVSIPSTNCILSIVGCFVLVVISLAVAATHTCGESIIECNSTAPVVAEAMTNTDKFPRLLLNLSVEQHDTAGAQARLVQLDRIEMVAAEFVEKRHPLVCTTVSSRKS